MRENGAASGAGVLALYAYDNLGRRASLTRGNGVVTTYAYDSASRLDVLTHNLIGAGADVTLDFAHNAAGQIVSRDRTSSNGSYVYPQPTPNADSYASNGLNQIASLDGAGFTHDARGNLTSAGGVSYTYDAFNRLTAAGPLALVYDPAGRLYETTASGTTTRFLYAGLQAIGEYNTSGTLLRRYVPGAGLDEHLTWYEGTGTSDRRGIVQDDLGSVVSIADSSGAALNVNSYDEYGMPASGNSGLFGYTGQMWLQSAGLYHYRTRAYSPALGRFLQTDPIGYADGLNLYAYVQNDPVNAVDPLGLQGMWSTEDQPPITVTGPPRPPVEWWSSSAHANLLLDRGALLARINDLRPREPQSDEEEDIVVEGRRLSECEIDALDPFFGREFLMGVRIHDVPPSWLPQGYGGVTVGTNIYLRPGQYDQSTAEGVGLLAEEIYHAGQYSYPFIGMTVPRYGAALGGGFLFGDAYGGNIYEQQAQAYRYGVVVPGLQARAFAGC